MAEVVVDSSAAMAVLNQEPGGDAIVPLLQGAHTPTLMLAEIATNLVRRGFPDSLIAEMVAGLELTPHDLTPERALGAARMWRETKSFGLSLGDRVCLALAFELRLPVITADRAWVEVGLPLDIRLIR